MFVIPGPRGQIICCWLIVAVAGWLVIANPEIGEPSGAARMRRMRRMRAGTWMRLSADDESLLDSKNYYYYVCVCLCVPISVYLMFRRLLLVL